MQWVKKELAVYNAILSPAWHVWWQLIATFEATNMADQFLSFCSPWCLCVWQTTLVMAWGLAGSSNYHRVHNVPRRSSTGVTTHLSFCGHYCCANSRYEWWCA
jgi:hypothetical protein